MTEDIRDFNASEIGTKEYWDEAYETELSNFYDIGDVGEIWFGKGIQKRMINWIDNDVSVSKEDKILDLGCGNGVLLVDLRKLGYKYLFGVDYSDKAVDLANQIAASEGISDITFQTADILCTEIGHGSCVKTNQYKICLDKGTYDAISLKPEKSDEARKKYQQVVNSVLTNDGRLVITSCNWTKDQLLSQFSQDFTLEIEIPTPKFQFGGSTGSTVVSLVFRKNGS